MYFILFLILLFGFFFFLKESHGCGDGAKKAAYGKQREKLKADPSKKKPPVHHTNYLKKKLGENIADKEKERKAGNKLPEAKK